MRLSVLERTRGGSSIFACSYVVAFSAMLAVFPAPMVSVCASEPVAEAKKRIDSKAYVIPKHTATEGEGYFAIIEGHNRCLYIGTHANAVNSWLVEFNTVDKKMRIAVDAHQAIGTDLKGFGSQSKMGSPTRGKRRGRAFKPAHRK